MWIDLITTPERLEVHPSEKAMRRVMTLILLTSGTVYNMKTMVELLAKQTRMQHNNHQFAPNVDVREFPRDNQRRATRSRGPVADLPNVQTAILENSAQFRGQLQRRMAEHDEQQQRTRDDLEHLLEPDNPDEQDHLLEPDNPEMAPGV
jgi:hypothetical protein